MEYELVLEEALKRINEKGKWIRMTCIKLSDKYDVPYEQLLEDAKNGSIGWWKDHNSYGQDVRLEQEHPRIM